MADQEFIAGSGFLAFLLLDATGREEVRVQTLSTPGSFDDEEGFIKALLQGVNCNGGVDFVSSFTIMDFGY